MKIHVIGITGSGKTTLADRTARRFAIPAYDLDWIVYDQTGERPLSEIVGRIEAIRREGGWVAEGVYRDAWLQPILRDADGIVWLDLPLAVCVFRMLARHVLAEARRNNAHPGWRRLFSFLWYTVRTHPRQRAETRALLAPYTSKVTRCRSSRDVRRLEASLGRHVSAE